jgi:predicted dinucleotide-binding enzyme
MAGMRVGVLGTGMVGNVLGTRLVEVGHHVVMGSRTAGNEKAVAWAAAQPAGQAGEGSFADAAAHGELLINATSGLVSVDALTAAGADNLAGKTLIDVSNALDHSAGFPPIVGVGLDDSVGERIQRTFPDVKVVKALNTMNCQVMADPGRLGGEHDVFLAGEDAGAKEEVSALLESFGWPRAAIRDLGGISAARGPELYVALWLQLMVASGDADFNIHVAR